MQVPIQVLHFEWMQHLHRAGVGHPQIVELGSLLKHQQLFCDKHLLKNSDDHPKVRGRSQNCFVS